MQKNGYGQKGSWKDRIVRRKKPILCIVASILLAGLWGMMQQGDAFDGHTLPRAGYGGISQEYQLHIEGLFEEGEETELTVAVEPRAYTEVAAAAAFAELAEGLPEMICGENSSLKEVRTDLSLIRSVPDTGIRLTWYPGDAELISYDGTVYNQELQEARETSLRAVMTDGTFDDVYVFDVTVLPRILSGREAVLQQFERLLFHADQEQITGEQLELPDEFEGRALRYRMEPGKDWVYILGLGAAAAILLQAKERTDQDKVRKARETELLIDYSELVSKLIVYLGAGLTIKNAWQKITENYLEARKAGLLEERVVYEEMLMTQTDMKKGIPEGEAYQGFARRIRLRSYTRLCAILEQNRKNGGRNLRSLLTAEMESAFEERKNTAKRRGEEAGTKLLLPLFLMLMIVMVIVVLPAMFSMG